MALLSPTMPVYERGYLEQLAAEVDGKFRIAQQRLRRLQNISEGYVAQKEIEDTLTELDALREQKHVLEPKSGQKIELRAPVSGIISVANVRPGQVVNARDTLFEIVDPARLWVEAIGAGGLRLRDRRRRQRNRGKGGPSAHLCRTGADASPTFAPDLLQGRGRAGRSPSAPRVKVILQTGAPVQGIVLPSCRGARPQRLPSGSKAAPDASSRFPCGRLRSTANACSSPPGWRRQPRRRRRRRADQPGPVGATDVQRHHPRKPRQPPFRDDRRAWG